MNDNPLEFKLRILPVDNCDAEKLTSEIERAGLVNRYVVGNKRFLQVRNFLKHQNPHYREPPSMIPPFGPGLRFIQGGGGPGLNGVGRHGEPGMDDRLAPGSGGFERGVSPSDPVCDTVKDHDPEDFRLTPDSGAAQMQAHASGSQSELPGTPPPGLAKRKPRQASAKEKLYAKLFARRAENLPSSLPDVRWNAKRINTSTHLKQIIEEDVDETLVISGLDLFCRDTYALEQSPPAPLALFIAQWSRWATEAHRNGGSRGA